MNKLILILPIMLVACVANTDFNGVDMDKANEIYATEMQRLKPLSQECRKVNFVSAAIMAAYTSKDNNDYTQMTAALCAAYTLYSLDYAKINLMVETDGKYASDTMFAIYNNCAEIVIDEGDNATLVFANEGDKLKEYLRKHRDECLPK